MGQINTNNYPTVSSLADADLLIVENATHGTGTTTPKQLRENAIGTDPLQTTAQTVTGAINEIFEMATDTVVGLELGKMTSFSDGVIVTDIDLHRAPIVEDRLLIYFDEKVTNPTGLTTYNNGTAVTSGLESVIPLYINAGWNILKYESNLLNTGWVRVQNVPVPDTLAGMSDTLIVSPSDGQMLVYENNMWKNKTAVQANPTGTAVRELKKIQIGDNIFDTFGLKTYDVSSVTSGVSGAIAVDVITASQLNGEIIAIHTGSNTGSTGNAWTLALSDSQTVEALTMSKADGTAFTDALTANSLMFVKVNTSNDTAVVLGIVGAGSNVSANGSGSPVAYLNKLKIGSAVYDTSAIRPFSVSQIANNTVKIYVADIDQLDGKVIALSTGALTGTTSSAWSLNMVDTSGGAASLDVSMLNADGTAFSDDISANELLFVAIDLTNYEGVILSVVGKSEDEIKTATGNPITLSDALAGNAISVSAEITAVQSGSGTPSPTNVRPISGFSSVVISREDAEGQTATVTVSLGSTVYGGTLDLTSGELTVTHGYKDLGTLSWNKDTTTRPADGATIHAFYAGISEMKTVANTNIGNIMCSQYVADNVTSVDYGGYYDVKDGIIGGADINSRIWIYDSRYNDYSTSEFKSAMSGVQVVYELATPTTTTLTPTQLALVKGYNQLSCNSGDMEITYKASGLDALKERVDDLDDAVEDLTADVASKTENSVVGNVENGTTASQAYAVGEHFIRNDKFCTCISAIASGATLTLSTNYVEGTIAECIARQGTYSTTETEIGTWLGQRLYRKVIDCGNMPSATSKDVSSGLSGIRVHKIYGNFNTSTTVGPLPFVAESINSGIKMFYNYTTNKIHLETATDFSNFTGEVVLEYTKNS